MTVRLLTYNIRKGGAGREAPLAEVIAQAAPDIVILQEATRPAVVAELGRRLGLQGGSVAGGSVAFLSRLPIVHHAWHRPRVSRHAFLEVAPRDLPVRIVGVHLSAVHAAWTERRRALELHALLRSIAAHTHGFHVLTGDFNTLAPGELLEMRRLPRRLRALVWLSGGTVRYQTIRRILDAGYADAYRSLHPDSPGPTFPTWDPHVRLDYLFLPAADAGRVCSCEVVTAGPVRDASDHLPLLSTVDVSASAGACAPARSGIDGGQIG
jgi:exodeoxyribonuclease-3